ncbi:MAG: hypothetical protein JJU36_01330 [Phycisphaeraceae bacterium]|nr:hypothetical protein [Phycisphaeraceae bacterium]
MNKSRNRPLCFGVIVLMLSAIGCGGEDAREREVQQPPVRVLTQEEATAGPPRDAPTQVARSGDPDPADRHVSQPSPRTGSDEPVEAPGIVESEPEEPAQTTTPVDPTQTGEELVREEPRARETEVEAGPVASGPSGGDYLSALARSRNIAQRTQSANNLRNLYLAAEMFRAQQGGRYPGSMEELLEQMPDAATRLVSPRDHRTPFVYVPPRDPRQFPANAVLGYDPTIYPGEVLNVVMGDGSVERMTVEALREALNPTPDK